MNEPHSAPAEAVPDHDAEDGAGEGVLVLHTSLLGQLVIPNGAGRADELDMPILLTEDPQAMGTYTPKGEAARERRWTGKHRMLVNYEHASSRPNWSRTCR